MWRVVRLDGPAALSQIEGAMVGADGLLVEPKVEGFEGGAGIALDLSLAAEARRLVTQSAVRSPRYVLAGGLTPDTVRTTIRTVRPDIVDVSSGVESSPGVKDPVRIRRFLAEALADHPSP